jgi:hypothetical protein
LRSNPLKLPKTTLLAAVAVFGILTAAIVGGVLKFDAMGVHLQFRGNPAIQAGHSAPENTMGAINNNNGIITQGQQGNVTLDQK